MVSRNYEKESNDCSGYFNPIDNGCLEYFNDVSLCTDELAVVNNDA
tara:strand:+ start:1400 stop:1537 length:138 start_codon:yes stop_codon:yes gene_type:complete